MRSTNLLGAAVLLAAMAMPGLAQKSAYTASPAEIWPPNDKMVDIQIVDTKGNPIVAKIISVTQDEGNAKEDVIVGKGAVQVRAARDGDGAGRTYAITFVPGKVEIPLPDKKRAAQQLSRPKGEQTVTVFVPHDRGNGKAKGRAAVCPCWSDADVGAVTWTS